MVLPAERAALPTVHLFSLPWAFALQSQSSAWSWQSHVPQLTVTAAAVLLQSPKLDMHGKSYHQHEMPCAFSPTQPALNSLPAWHTDQPDSPMIFEDDSNGLPDAPQQPHFIRAAAAALEWPSLALPGPHSLPAPHIGQAGPYK